MNIKNFDLNLLIVFKTLFEEKNVKSCKGLGKSTCALSEDPREDAVRSIGLRYVKFFQALSDLLFPEADAAEPGPCAGAHAWEFAVGEVLPPQRTLGREKLSEDIRFFVERKLKGEAYLEFSPGKFAAV